MHSPPISASLLFIYFFLGLIYLSFFGEERVAGVESTLCLCDASDGALLQHAHCGPPHPLTSSSSMFLDTLHRPLAPHSICASCLPLTGLQYERAGMDSDSQYELQPKPAYCTASKKKKKKKVNLLFYSIFMWIFTTALYCFLQSRAADSFYSDSSHIKC